MRNERMYTNALQGPFPGAHCSNSLKLTCGFFFRISVFFDCFFLP